MALVATFTCSIGPEALQALRACASEASSIDPACCSIASVLLRKHSWTPPPLPTYHRSWFTAAGAPIPRASVLAGYAK
jgi:hypothetical protein